MGLKSLSAERGKGEYFFDAADRHVVATFRTERIMAHSAVGKHLHLIPGLGEVDFQETFDYLAEIGYGGHVSVQLISHVDRPAEAAVRAREYLQKSLAQQ